MMSCDYSNGLTVPIVTDLRQLRRWPHFESVEVNLRAILFGLLMPVIALCQVNAAHAQEDDPFIIHPRADWKFHAHEVPPTADWIHPEYDDTNWAIGAPGFGYGDDDDATILNDMEDGYLRVQVRREFELETIPRNLYLFVNYDDAFVLYVNGEQVKSVGVTKRGVESHEAEGFEVFKLKREHFVKGKNLIAIEGFNQALDSSDFSLWPFLATSRKALSGR